MGYKFREVQCFKCKHIFMWKKENESVLYEYHMKDTNVLLNLAGCPKCNASILVVPHVLEGIPEDSDKVFKSGIRGI